MSADSCGRIEVIGNVSNIKTQSGDVEISGDVSGSVQTMSGDVECGNIGGSVSTMSGDISGTAKRDSKRRSKVGEGNNYNSCDCDNDIVTMEFDYGSGDKRVFNLRK